jgi:hypothetical protein
MKRDRREFLTAGALGVAAGTLVIPAPVLARERDEKKAAIEKQLGIDDLASVTPR